MSPALIQHRSQLSLSFSTEICSTYELDICHHPGSLIWWWNICFKYISDHIIKIVKFLEITKFSAIPAAFLNIAKFPIQQTLMTPVRESKILWSWHLIKIFYCLVLFLHVGHSCSSQMMPTISEEPCSWKLFSTLFY